MNPDALTLLKKIAKLREVSLESALLLTKPSFKDHRDQYPLALLIEGGYLGTTIQHAPPKGAEYMKEYALAVTLHRFTLPPDVNGQATYMGIKSEAGVDPKKENVFIGTAGMLYMEESSRAFRERLLAFACGLGIGLMGMAALYAKTQMALQ